MAGRIDHVDARDGHHSLGGPRPDVPPRPNRAPRQHPPAPAAFSGRYSTDSSFVGKVEVDKATFEGISGHPSPRQKLERGEAIDGKHDRVAPGGVHQEPSDVSIAGAAPLT
jgi:hypothetical protein